MKQNIMSLLAGMLIGGGVFVATTAEASTYITGSHMLTYAGFQTIQRNYTDYYDWTTSGINIDRGYLDVENTGDYTFTSRVSYIYFDACYPACFAWWNLTSPLEPEESDLLTHDFDFEEEWGAVSFAAVFFWITCSYGDPTQQGFNVYFEDDGTTVDYDTQNEFGEGC